MGDIANPSDVCVLWHSEETQTDTITLTNQSTYYQLFTAYESDEFIVKGIITLKFEASQTYTVRIKQHSDTNDYEDEYTFVIGATATSKTIYIGPTRYCLVEVACTTASGKTVTYYRCFEFIKHCDMAAPTVSP